MKKIDLNALKQLSNIELFLLLCGTMTIPFAVPPYDGVCQRTDATSNIRRLVTKTP